MKQVGTPLSGQVVIHELIRNMEMGQLEMGYSVLVPCIFNVYLHPDDFARLSRVQRHLKEEAKRALSERLANANGRSSLLRRPSKKKQKEFRIAANDWVIELFADTENSVPQGDVEIHSELNDVPQPGYRGTRTTLLDRDPTPTGLRLSATSPASAAAAAPAPAPIRAYETTYRPVNGPYAEIRYVDDSGPQIYPVTQNELTIGRGGEDQWVDVPLYANEEVSREHARLRRDPSGRFFITDQSRNGTWLNGRKLKRGVEEAVPDKAEISVAETILLSFEVRK